jgi:SAM-dependent methyltransferase
LGVSFDRVADRYDTTRGYPENIMRDILEALDGELRKEDLILDAGMGTGRFARPLQTRGYQIVGIDIAGRMIKKAQEKGVENILRADLLALPFQDLVFDKTISIHVLHLIKNWKSALVEIGRVTKDELVSVAFNKEESPAQEIRNAYDRACEELGHSVRHPGVRERELPDVLQPDNVKPIVVHEHPVDVRSLIQEFETRTYSNQWTVPDEIHEEAIELLKEQFGDLDQVQGIERISLIVWNADKLRKLSCD